MQVIDFSWEKQGRELKVEKARSLETLKPQGLSSTHFLHRHFKWTAQGNLRFPDLESGDWKELNPLNLKISTYSMASLSNFEAAESMNEFYLAGLKFRISNSGRTLELLDPKDLSRNMWILQIPSEHPIEWQNQGEDALWGLSRQGHMLISLNPRNLKSLTRWNWDSSMELMDLVLCPGGVQVLVEQSKTAQPLTRFVRFRGSKPASYTVFDLSGGQKKSDLTQVLSRNCLEFYVTGPYGLQRIRY